MADLAVVVTYDDLARADAFQRRVLDVDARVVVVSKRETVGRSAARNEALAEIYTPLIGFLDPSMHPKRQFSFLVESLFAGNAAMKVLIGPGFFARTEWLRSQGGFDEAFLRYGAEEDLIRRLDAEAVGTARLPFRVSPPTDMVEERHYRAQGEAILQRKWG